MGTTPLWIIIGMCLGYLVGYWIGHYEGLRCSCSPRRQHFLRRWLRMPLTQREIEARNN